MLRGGRTWWPWELCWGAETSRHRGSLCMQTAASAARWNGRLNASRSRMPVLLAAHARPCHALAAVWRLRSAARHIECQPSAPRAQVCSATECGEWCKCTKVSQAGASWLLQTHCKWVALQVGVVCGEGGAGAAVLRPQPRLARQLWSHVCASCRPAAGSGCLVWVHAHLHREDARTGALFCVRCRPKLQMARLCMRNGVSGNRTVCGQLYAVSQHGMTPARL